MSEFIFFLGRFHVLVLHLPIGMLLLTVTLDFFSRSARYHYLSPALPLCWAATALTAVLTVVLGLMHFSEGGFAGPAASTHRNYGISVAVVSLLVWMLISKIPSWYAKTHVHTNVLLLFLITMTGHYGGNLTHGATYLVEYAPGPIRAMAGLQPRRAAVTDITLADPWFDIVYPMLQARCSTCHNNDKQNGQLNLSTLESLLAGGKSGPVLSKGDADNSELYLRITLPSSHEDFMPAEGKTPLTEAQRNIIRWWINSGMPADTMVADIAVDDEMAALLALELGLGSAAGAQQEQVYLPLSSEMLDQVVNAGWQIRPLSQVSNGLMVSNFAKGKAVTQAMLQALSTARESIVEVNLASTGLTDELLALLADYPVLQTLNLSNNGLSDQGMEIVRSDKSLQVINLYGNPLISDNGLARLAALKELRTVYTWGTGVTEEGIAALMAALPGLTVYGQSSTLLPNSTATE